MPSAKSMRYLPSPARSKALRVPSNAFWDLGKDGHGLRDQRCCRGHYAPAGVKDALKVVANGDGAITFVLTSVIRSVKGVELVGTLPPELQTYVTFTGTVASNTKEADGARAQLQFLTSDAAVTMIKAKGLDVAAR
jgi:extracellular solute-binding protein